MGFRLKTIARDVVSYFSVWASKEVYGPKVFCIGYNKTGTTSVGIALAMLGFKHSSFNKRVWRAMWEKGRINSVIEYTAKFESFDDLPWLKEEMIPILDTHFPGSKFVYLERSEAEWKESLVRWSERAKGRTPNADVERQNYEKHRDFVKSYFSEKPEVLITLSVRDPKGFKKLGDFVGRQAPQDGFPHANRSSR